MTAGTFQRAGAPRAPRESRDVGDKASGRPDVDPANPAGMREAEPGQVPPREPRREGTERQRRRTGGTAPRSGVREVRRRTRPGTTAGRGPRHRVGSRPEADAAEEGTSRGEGTQTATQHRQPGGPAGRCGAEPGQITGAGGLCHCAPPASPTADEEDDREGREDPRRRGQGGQARPAGCVSAPGTGLGAVCTARARWTSQWPKDHPGWPATGSASDRIADLRYRTAGGWQRSMGAPPMFPDWRGGGAEGASTRGPRPNRGVV